MTKTILVTGVTSGFGRAIMEKFLAEGHRVIGIARRKDRLDAIKVQYGDAVHMVEVGIGSVVAIEEFFKNLPQTWSDIDVLVNNAGLALGTERAYERDLNDWDTMIDVNVR